MSPDRPTLWGPIQAQQTAKSPLVARGQGESNPNSRVERLKEKKQPSLGELNPMLFAPDFSNADAIDALRITTEKQIEAYGGTTPTSFGTRLVVDADGNHHYRLVAKFDLSRITEDQVAQLEAVVEAIYGKTVRHRKTSSGHQIKPTNYPTVETTSRGRPKLSERNRMLGWYMGMNENPVSPLHTGVLVYKDLGGADMANYVHNKKPEDWFFKTELLDPMSGKPVKTRHIVEIREAGLYQTDTAMLVTEVASILAGKGIIPYDELFYNTYNSLNRLGTEEVRATDISGLEDQIQRINRALFVPLGNLELSSGIELKPGSVLLIGYMGTGKTHLIKHFLQSDTGTLLVPVDVAQLAADLSRAQEHRTLLPRIYKVFNKYQIPIILHIDDVETIAQTDEQVNSTLLNLMAGIRDLGFYVVAATNYPEKLSPQLLQPQRFAHVVHLGLPGAETRYGILDIHATRLSRELKKELFESDGQREKILRAIAKSTQGTTARVLADICTEAKTFFEVRQKEASGRTYGLTEQDICGSFIVEDWENGLNEALKKNDREVVVKRDKELAEFANRHYRQIGFRNGESNVVRLRDLMETEDERLAARTDQSFI